MLDVYFLLKFQHFPKDSRFRILDGLDPVSRLGTYTNCLVCVRHACRGVAGSEPEKDPLRGLHWKFSNSGPYTGFSAVAWETLLFRCTISPTLLELQDFLTW